MARAVAICRCATCGSEFEIYGYKANRREADNWESWAESHYDECKVCRDKRIQAEREETNRASAENSKTAGLPDLIGSEKQVAWANTLRDKVIHDLKDNLTKVEDFIAKEEDADRQAEGESAKENLYAAYYVLMKKTKAAWWIDNAREGFYGLTLSKDFCKQVTERVEISKSTPVVDEDIVIDAVEEMMVTTENVTHAGSAEIFVSDTEVSVLYEKNDDFRAVVKSLDFSWDNGRWRKHIGVTTGTSAERAAELGNKLLNAGFAIRIADDDIRDAAISGDYEPQSYRWITSISNGKYAGNLFIRWGKKDDLYFAARAIHGSKYDRPGVVVSPREFAQIEDFAAAYDFKFSPGALKVIEEAKASVMVVRPAQQKNAEYEEHQIADVLNSSADVLEDLRD